MYFERFHKNQLAERLQEPRRFIQVVYGPRQVGKTTMIRQLLQGVTGPFHSVTADSVSVSYQVWVAQQWEVARFMLKQSGVGEALLIIDEIQKIENWSEIVKREWDYDTANNINLKVVLLGSSRLLLQQGLTESLAGRFETLYMGHWSFLEMKQAFDIGDTQFIWFGGYPGAIDLINDENRWKRYISDSLIEPSINRDILMLTRIDKPALMRRLFELGCQYSGQILSFNKILGQLLDAGNTTTLSHYLELLDTAGLLTGIEKFNKGIIRQRSSSPKFQVYNTALMSAQSSFSLKETLARPEIWGRWVESAVGAHLVNNSVSGRFSVTYWRERNNEVDFVLSSKEKVVALEVKSAAKVRTRGMTDFQKKFNPYKVYLVGTDGIPVSEFLKTNPEELL